jgi:ribosome recycling factor
MVDYYGSPTPLSGVANLTLIDARTIGVQPYEKKMLSTIEKAIRDADLGLNPSTFGEMIRVPTPALTEERRKEMVKLVKTEAEDAKIAVRNVRRDANEQLKKLVKDKAISEDDERRAQDDIQKMTDKAVVDIDKLVAEKEKEIMTVYAHAAFAPSPRRHARVPGWRAGRADRFRPVRFRCFCLSPQPRRRRIRLSAAIWPDL